MERLIHLLGSIPSPVYFFTAITLLLLLVLVFDDRPPEFWCVWATLLNFMFLVLTYFSNSAGNLLVWAFMLIPLCFYITAATKPQKQRFFFKALVFIVMAAVFCVMFDYIHVVLCQHGRLLQGLLRLLGEVGVVNLQEVTPTNIQAYHIIACLVTFTILFSFSAIAYLTSPFILSSIRRIKLKCTKFWEEGKF